MILEAKIQPKYLAEILNGEKNFEFRELNAIEQMILTCTKFNTLECSGSLNDCRKHCSDKSIHADCRCRVSFRVKNVAILPMNKGKLVRDNHPKVPWKSRFGRMIER